MMAEELGLNGRLARRCGLLHDIGKAADHEMEGGHPKIGAELASRYGETSKEVLHAIAGHHDDVTIDHIYTVLVAAADAISAVASRRPPRDAGEVRQASGGTGSGGVGLSRRRARLRHPGRPRGARHRQRLADHPTATRSRSATTSPGPSRSSCTTPARSRSRWSARRGRWSSPAKTDNRQTLRRQRSRERSLSRLP